MNFRRIALFVVLAALVAPLFITAIPPLLDYPNHLARMAILVQAGRDADLSAMYAIDWHIVPNLGMDMVVPVLAKIFPLDVAGRIFIALALILPVLGTVALHRAVFRKPSLWPLASALFVYNATLLAGFLNFMVGAGLALLGAACWVRLKDKPVWQIAATAIIAVPVFFTHLFGVGFMFLVIGSFELNQAWQHRTKPAKTFAQGIKLGLCLLPIAALYFNTRFADDGTTSPFAVFKTMWWALYNFNPMWKLTGLAAGFLTYDTQTDLTIMVAFIAIIATLALTRKFGGAFWLVALTAALFVLYPFVPNVMTGTGWIDFRLPVLAGFLFFAGTFPRRLSRRGHAIVGLLFVLLMGARLSVIASAWQEQNSDLADLSTVMQPIKTHDRVLVVVAAKAEPAAPEPKHWQFFAIQPSIWHIAAPTLVERRAFFPQLFATGAKQLLRVQPPYDKIADDTVGPPYERVLWGRDHWAATDRKIGYIQNWQHDFDYVLVLAESRMTTPAQDYHPEALEFVATSKFAALYRVKERATEQRAMTAQR